MKILLTVAAALAVNAIAGPAAAATITTLHSTGVDDLGAVLTGHGADGHWTLDGGAAYTGGTNGTFPIGPWIADTSTSRWLTPKSSAGDAPFDPVDGIYTYTQTFSLAGFKPSTASFSGNFASDNTVDRITLNGTTINGSGGSFASMMAFNSTGALFKAGLNTLTFTVRNAACYCSNPTGLKVDVAGTAEAVPEPTTWAMFVGGFGLIGVAARRRGTIATA